MAADGSLLEFESVPISVTDDGRTVRDPAHGRPTRCAMRWKNLDAFYNDLTALENLEVSTELAYAAPDLG